MVVSFLGSSDNRRERENKVIFLISNILSLLLSVFTIIFRHKDPCVTDTGMSSLMKMVRI